MQQLYLRGPHSHKNAVPTLDLALELSIGMEGRGGVSRSGAEATGARGVSRSGEEVAGGRGMTPTVTSTKHGAAAAAAAL